MPLMSHIQDIEQRSWRTTLGVAPHSASPWKLLSDRSETTCSMCVEWKRVGSCHKHPKIFKNYHIGSFNKAPLDQQTKCAAECLEVIPKLAYLVSLSVRLSAQNCDFESETAHSKHMFAGHYVVFIFCWTMLKALVWPLWPLKLSQKCTYSIQ